MAFLCTFIAVSALSFTSVSGQTTINIKGKVLDESKQPLTGVLIIPNPGKPEYTDEYGIFNISASKGNITITLRYLGNEDIIIEQTIKSESIDMGEITMNEKSILLKEVNVSGTALPYKSSFEGSNYYVSPLQLKKIQPISTEEVLKTLPGVNVLGDMGLSNRLNVSIRGSWGRRSEKVLMLEDGSPISPAPYTAPGIYYNPISDRVDDIEAGRRDQSGELHLAAKR